MNLKYIYIYVFIYLNNLVGCAHAQPACFAVFHLGVRSVALGLLRTDCSPSRPRMPGPDVLSVLRARRPALECSLSGAGGVQASLEPQLPPQEPSASLPLASREILD